MIQYAKGAVLTIYAEALGVKRKIRKFLGLRFIESDRSYRKRALRQLEGIKKVRIWILPFVPGPDTKFGRFATHDRSTHLL